LSPAPLRRLAINLLQRIEQSRRIEVVHVTPDFYAKGWELYSNRLDKDWDVIDCISFVIMQERKPYRSSHERPPLRASRFQNSTVISASTLFLLITPKTLSIELEPHIPRTGDEYETIPRCCADGRSVPRLRRLRIRVYLCAGGPTCRRSLKNVEI
jgi:hypothetical protein